MNTGISRRGVTVLKSVVAALGISVLFMAPTPVAAQDFTLDPATSASRLQVSQGDSSEFSFNITNDGPGTSNSTAWGVQEIIFGPTGGTGNALAGGYDRTCQYYLDRGARSCKTLHTAPARTFNVGTTDVSNDVPASARTVTGGAALGTKVCRILTVEKPLPDSSAIGPRWSDVSCVILSRRPNVHFFGGDIAVGNPFKSQRPDCSLRSGTGNIYTAVNAANNGSSTEYGAFARGIIQVELAIGHSFGTASRTGFTRANTDRLAFANTGDQPGLFENNRCQPDYYERFRNQTPAAASPGTISLSGRTGRVRLSYNGQLNISASNIARGANIVVVVEGNVNIAGNILYTGSENPNYSDTSDIPGLAIIASGNVTIDDSVTQVDGAIISKGIFSTCTSAPAQLTTRVCNKQLKYNGAVFTDGFRVPRTFGGDGANAEKPAENFHFTTEMFFNNVLAEKRDDLIDVIEVRDLPPRY